MNMLLHHDRILHLLISIIFHMLIMRTVERMIGWIRMAIIYFACGAVGSLASATLLPYQVEVSFFLTLFYELVNIYWGIGTGAF